MQDLMLINNVLYALRECPGPQFLLKTELQEAMDKEQIVTIPPLRDSMEFNGKYYAYYKVKPKENEQSVCKTGDGNS